jgi:hypothetical protein
MCDHGSYSLGVRGGAEMGAGGGGGGRPPPTQRLC